MTPSVPADLLDHVVRRLDPVAVYLFGSRARGTAGPDSDIDLFAVVDDDAVERAWAVKRELDPEIRSLGHGPVDVVTTSRSRFSRYRHLPGTLDEAVEGEGVRLYSRDADVANEGAVSRVEEPIEEWLELARTDLKTVGIVIDDDDLTAQSAVLLQQALEKLLKAELVGRAVRTWKTHDLVELAAAAGPQAAARLVDLDLEEISRWAVAPRYSRSRPPQISEVVDAYPVIKAYYDDLRTRYLQTT